MSDLSAEQQASIAHAFVAFGDVSAGELDGPAALLLLIESCRALLNTCEFSVALVESGVGLRVVAASSEAIKLIDERQIEDGEGPLIEALSLENAVLEAQTEDAAGRWPRFGPLVRAVGFESICAIPLRTYTEVIGVLEVFNHEEETISDIRMDWLRTLATGAAVGIGSKRSHTQLTELAGQLQGALNSRVVIEQAKGVIAAKLGIGIEPAFDMLRRYCRNAGRPIHDVARDVIGNRITGVELRLVPSRQPIAAFKSNNVPQARASE